MQSGAVAFVAALNQGPPAGAVFVTDGAGTVARVVAPGTALVDGGTLVSLGLYPTVALASDGTVSLLGIVERDGEQASAVLRYGPAPAKSP